MSGLYSIQNARIYRNETALRNKGLDAFKCYIGPSTGPRYLCTAGFEHALYDAAFEDRLTGEKWLVGGSMGALRFLCFLKCLICENKAFLKQLQSEFTSMIYTKHSSPEDLARMMQTVYDTVTPNPSQVEEVLRHPRFHLAIFVARAPNYLLSLPRRLLLCHLYLIGALSYVQPAIEEKHFTSLCFYTGKALPPFANNNDNIVFCRLTRDNIYDVVRATTTIPGISVPCPRIFGLRNGYYCDGGLVHFELGFDPPEDLPSLLLTDGPAIHKTAIQAGLGLFRTVPKSVYVIYPRHSFTMASSVTALPCLRDWFRKEYIQTPALRIARWTAVYDLSVRQFPRTNQDLANILNRHGVQRNVRVTAHKYILSCSLFFVQCALFVSLVIVVRQWLCRRKDTCKTSNVSTS